MPCNSAPDIPRDEPTSKDASNLGNLSSQIMVWFISSPCLKIANQISWFEIYTEPLASESKEIIIKKDININNEIKNFLFGYLIFLMIILLLLLANFWTFQVKKKYF